MSAIVRKRTNAVAIFIAAVATARAQVRDVVLNKINGGSEESLLNCQTYTRLFDQWDVGLRDDVTIFLDLVDLKFLGLVQRQ